MILFITLAVFLFFSVTHPSTWESIGPDGGDMHFVYITNEGIVFASHGFGGVWRNEDGENWTQVKQDDFVNLAFFSMSEENGILYAGSNKGIWRSLDQGLTWERINVDLPLENYEVVSLAVANNTLYFSLRVSPEKKGKVDPKNGFFKLDMSSGSLEYFQIPGDEGDSFTVVKLFYGPPLFVSSSSSGLYIFSDGDWEKILDEPTTRVFWDGSRVYVGTIGDGYFIGENSSDGWRWWRVDIPEGECGICEFIVPDPYNPEKLWLGASGESRGSLYKTDKSGLSYAAIVFWTPEDGVKEHFLSWNWATEIAIDSRYAYTSEYGVEAGVAYIPRGGRGCIQKTEDGGRTWSKGYYGLNGDTINMISFLTDGIRSGDIVVTAVSGTEVFKDYGTYKEEGIDFTIGDIGYGLPGYTWGAASPESKIDGRYDLLIATGYPPADNSSGDGIYAVDTECLKGGIKRCFKRIAPGPFYELHTKGDLLYGGRMDEGLDIVDLSSLDIIHKTFQGGILHMVFDGDNAILCEVIGGNKNTDSYMFRDSSIESRIYVCSSSIDNCSSIYSGDGIVSISAYKGHLLALDINGNLLYFPNYNDGTFFRYSLPKKHLSDMAVDWDGGRIFLSAFSPSTFEDGGVYKASFSEIFSGNLTSYNYGLMDLRVRNLRLAGGYLLAGTEGNSVWRIKLENKISTTLDALDAAEPDQVFSFSVDEPASISFNLFVPKEDIGKEAELLLYVEGGGTGSLASLGKTHLDPIQEFVVSKDPADISYLKGEEYTIYYGYMLGNGTIRYNTFSLNLL